MAKRYRAVNQIRHGVAGQEEPMIFQPGQDVTGLSKDAMVSLWEAGVLEEYDPDARPKDDRDDRIAALEKQIADLEAEKKAAADAPPPGGVVDEAPENPTPATHEAAVDLQGTVGDPPEGETTNATDNP